MFFPRLRRRAKWVFLALAIVFAGGFLVFGVGTGVQGSSLGDAFQDIFGSGGGGGPSVEDAREKVEDNPNDAPAYLELANALQAAGRNDEAIDAVLKYTELRPRDAEGLQQLAALYDGEATNARQRISLAQLEFQQKAPGTLFGPAADSELGQALSQDPVELALSQTANERITIAADEARAAYQRAADVYARLTLLEPEEPLFFLQLGQASEFAGDAEAAIAAYEQFLELSPDDPNAPLVRQQLELLQGQTEAE